MIQSSIYMNLAIIGDVISIHHTINQHLFSNFSHFCSPVKEKGKQGRITRTHHGAMDKSGSIFLLLVGLTARREVGQQTKYGWVSKL